MFIIVSSYSFTNWVYLYDDTNIPEPSHLLYSQYSKLHSQLPKSVSLNTFSSILETLSVKAKMFDLSTSLPKYSYSKKVGTLYACEHDLYLPTLLKYVHFQCCISVLANLDIDVVHLLSVRDTDILLLKLYGMLYDLLYVNLGDNQPNSKINNFIETKVIAINCRV